MFCPYGSFISYHPLTHLFLFSFYALITDLEMDSGSHVLVSLWEVGTVLAISTEGGHHKGIGWFGNY